jgi:hypothetical protein
MGWSLICLLYTVYAVEVAHFLIVKLGKTEPSYCATLYESWFSYFLSLMHPDELFVFMLHRYWLITSKARYDLP